MIAIYVQKTQARAELDAPVTSGSSGRGVEFRFSDDWAGLTKTAIFETDNYKDSKQIPESGVTTIPDSVLEYPGFQLRVGVYGKSAGGDVVTPTVYADCGTIKRGANTTPVGTPPTPSQAEALQKQIDVLSSRFDVWVTPGELEDVVSVDFTPVNLGDTATGKIASNGTHAVVTLTSSIVVNVAAGEELEIATIPEGFEPVTNGFVPYNAGKFTILKVKLNGGKVYLVNDTEENVATGKLPSTATFAYALKNPNITELTDIRVGYDGTIYETAGDAVREQINEAISVASTGVSPDVIKEAVEEYLKENDITAGKDGVGIASILQTAATTADGGRNVFTVTLTNGTTENFIVHNGNKGSPGKDGTSVTVESVSESAVDGGSNVVTFSDGKTLTVKNGSSGSVELDTTLTVEGKAADAKAVGDALANVINAGYLTSPDVFENAEVAKFKNIFDDVEIEYGKILNTDGTVSDTTAALATTGFIPVVGGDIIRMKDFAVYAGGSCRVVIYDATYTKTQLINYNNISADGYYLRSVATDESGNHTQFEFLRPSAGGYIRICTNTAVIGASPVLTINEEIKYEMGYGTKLRKDVMVDYSQITNAPEKNCWSILPDQRINIAYSSIGRKPINTVEHFVDAATNFGYNALKADVRPTADGELVCCHDAGFTFDANGYITAYNSANATMIRDVTAKTCLSYSFATGEHPCLVGDYLEICREHGKIAFVTIRNEYMDVVIPKLLEELKEHNMFYSTIVNCMTYNSLVEWRKVDADVMINFTLGYGANIDTEAIDKAAALGYCSLCGFGVNSSGTAPIITCDFGYAREKGVRLLQAIAYAEGTPEECYALGYDGCQIGYPWNPVLIGSGGADWDASEGEPGHVLHRTHYTEVVTGTVLAETAMVFGGDAGFYTSDPVAPVFAGEQYTVNWNGVEYRCVCKEIDEGGGTMAPAMGNFAAMGAGDDTGDPFLILVVPADVQADFTLLALSLDDTTELTLSITGKTESVTRLPKKYLPELRGQKKIVITRGTSDNSADVSYDDALKMDAAEFAASAVVLWQDCEFDVVSATKTPEADGENEHIRFAYISHGGENGAGRALHFGEWRKGGINFDKSPPYRLNLSPKGKVGQYLRVSAVDENGNVTAVEAVDAPSGGGEKVW